MRERCKRRSRRWTRTRNWLPRCPRSAQHRSSLLVGTREVQTSRRRSRSGLHPLHEEAARDTKGAQEEAAKHEAQPAGSGAAAADGADGGREMASPGLFARTTRGGRRTRRSSGSSSCCGRSSGRRRPRSGSSCWTTCPGASSGCAQTSAATRRGTTAIWRSTSSRCRKRSRRGRKTPATEMRRAGSPPPRAARHQASRPQTSVHSRLHFHRAQYQRIRCSHAAASVHAAMRMSVQTTSTHFCLTPSKMPPWQMSVLCS